jgi:hypothetical protein
VDATNSLPKMTNAQMTKMLVTQRFLVFRQGSQGATNSLHTRKRAFNTPPMGKLMRFRHLDAVSHRWKLHSPIVNGPAPVRAILAKLRMNYGNGEIVITSTLSRIEERLEDFPMTVDTVDYVSRVRIE